ncbi:MAG: hypothetical protein KBT07_07125 [Clostridiales bacterium]|nr:hypothetical protein [Candidatus Scatonaster coprocaballi]
MNKLLHELMNRKEELQKVIDNADSFLSKAPQGYLRIDHSKRFPHFYHVTQSHSNGKYINKENFKVAVSLAQKEYYQKMIIEAKDEMRQVERMVAFYESHSADYSYSDFSESKRALIKPVLLDDDTYARFWLAQTVETNPFYPDGLIRQTRRGEMVRSKTETFQANIYYELGIPYRYESILRMRNGNVYYPDFTLLDKRNRRVIIHEHLGLLDDEEYRRKTMTKLDDYERNGIYVGKNLILTSESPEHPFNPEQFRKRIQDTFQL